jgi:hypothetical protein
MNPPQRPPQPQQTHQHHANTNTRNHANTANAQPIGHNAAANIRPNQQSSVSQYEFEEVDDDLFLAADLECLDSAFLRDTNADTLRKTNHQMKNTDQTRQFQNNEMYVRSTNIQSTAISECVKTNEHFRQTTGYALNAQQDQQNQRPPFPNNQMQTNAQQGAITREQLCPDNNQQSQVRVSMTGTKPVQPRGYQASSAAQAMQHPRQIQANPRPMQQQQVPTKRFNI